MDKGKNMQAIISATMVLILLFAGQASARTSFKVCFNGCATKCLLVRNKITCALKCFGKCLIGLRPLGLDYCKHGCAVDQCARLITDDFEFEDVKKVVSCVNECDEIGGQCELSDLPIESTNGAPSPS